MVRQKDEDNEANLSHQSQSTISGELDCEQESVVKRHGSSSKCREGEADTWSNHLKRNEGDLDFCSPDSLLPASMSNHSNQKTSKETYSAIDSCGSESVQRRSEEPGIANSESDGSAQIADVNAMKISSLVGRYNEDNSQELDDVMIASEDGVADISNGTAPVCSDDFNSFNLRIKAKEDAKSPTDPDIEMINSDIAKGSCETQEIRTVKVEGDFTGNESSRPQMVQPDKVAIKNQDTCIFGFDLNEDLTTTNVMDDYVIRVAGKAGIPKSLPVFPLKFEGQRGWTGPSENSAFHVVVPKIKDRKTCPRTNSPKNQKMPLGFDLNVALVEDDLPNGLTPEPKYMSKPSSLQDSRAYDSRQTKRLKIDLNYSLCHNEDDPIQPFLGPKADDSLLRDLNVNASTLDKSESIPWLAQVHQSYGSQPEFKYASNYNSADLRTMQQHYAHGQQYLVAPAPYVLQTVDSISPLHQTLLLPPHNYLSTVPIDFGSSKIRTSGTIPYARSSQEQGISPQLPYPGIVQHSFGAPNIFNVIHDCSTGNNSSPSLPKVEVESDHDENLAAKGSKKA